MSKRFLVFGSVVVGLLAVMPAWGAELSDEQIELEISRIEKQAAVARKADKKTASSANVLDTLLLKTNAISEPVIEPLSTEVFGVAPEMVSAPSASAVAGKPSAAAAEESQIPVFSEAKKAEKEKGGDSLSRLSLSLGVLALVGLGAIFFLRRYSQGRREKLKHTQIKVLTQHHLGPKKSLTIVRVAGESLLLGVTDNSITLIKNLSLIDDEFPEELPSQFKAELDQEALPEARHVEQLAIEASTGDEHEEEFKMGSMIPRTVPQRGGRRWLT